MDNIRAAMKNLPFQGVHLSPKIIFKPMLRNLRKYYPIPPDRGFIYKVKFSKGGRVGTRKKIMMYQNVSEFFQKAWPGFHLRKSAGCATPPSCGT